MLEKIAKNGTTYYVDQNNNIYHQRDETTIIGYWISASEQCFGECLYHIGFTRNVDSIKHWYHSLEPHSCTLHKCTISNDCDKQVPYYALENHEFKHLENLDEIKLTPKKRRNWYRSKIIDQVDQYNNIWDKGNVIGNYRHNCLGGCLNEHYMMEGINVHVNDNVLYVKRNRVGHSCELDSCKNCKRLMSHLSANHKNRFGCFDCEVNGFKLYQDRRCSNCKLIKKCTVKNSICKHRLCNECFENSVNEKRELYFPKIYNEHYDSIVYLDPDDILHCNLKRKYIILKQSDYLPTLEHDDFFNPVYVAPSIGSSFSTLQKTEPPRCPVPYCESIICKHTYTLFKPTGWKPHTHQAFKKSTRREIEELMKIWLIKPENLYNIPLEVLYCIFKQISDSDVRCLKYNKCDSCNKISDYICDEFKTNNCIKCELDEQFDDLVFSLLDQ